MSMTFEQLQSLVEQTMIGLAETNKALAETNKALAETNMSLNRVEMIAESNARAIEATANKLDEKFDQIANAVIRSQDRLERLERRDRKVDKEIRGLRIETRRMLERWLGEPFTDDPDLDDDEPE
jgi:septal ring factor EnvC (AmiA/AmiB activator)